MEQRTRKRAPGRPKGSDMPSPMRDAVLAAATRLFMANGYEPVSVNQIAEEAGVTKASVYYYFSNKAQLFTVAVSELMRRIGGTTARILERKDSLRARLEAIAAAKLTSARHVEFESLMREALPSLTAEQQAEIRQAERSVHEVLAAGFEKAIASGEIAVSQSPILLAHAFSALLLLGNREADLSGEIGGSSLAKLLADLFWQGIGPRTA